MDDDLFQNENHKYSLLWQNGYKPARWKKLAKIAFRLAKSMDQPSLIDFGFGTGEAMDFFANKGFPVAGVDVSSYATQQQREKGRTVYNTTLDDLSMFSDNSFALGFCNDVIEHIPESLITHSLDEMVRVSKEYLLVSVCPTPSHHLSLDGENLHLTVKPTNWWEQTFQSYGTVQRIPLPFSRSARYVIKLHDKHA